MKKIFLLIAMVLSLPTLAHGLTIANYNPSLNTLPENQGWSVLSIGNNPTPTVVDQALHQEATASNSIYQWFAQTGPIDFDTMTPLVLDVDLRVAFSEYASFSPPDRWRAGYGLAIKDEQDRVFILGILEGGVRLTSSQQWLEDSSGSLVSFDTTSAFNNYRLVIADGNAELFINNTSVSTLTAGISQPPANWDTNTVRFGDLSINLKSIIDLRGVELTVQTVPEPSIMILLGISMVSVAGLRRKWKE